MEQIFPLPAALGNLLNKGLVFIMKKTSLLLGLFFLFISICAPVLADEVDDELDSLLESLDIEEDYKYEFPEIEPVTHMHLGYRFVDLDGSSRVFEYEYLENSVTFGGELRLFNFPHRFYLDVDYVNKKDYYGEMRYAYGDLVLFRWLNNSFYHNLDNIRLYDFGTLSPEPDAITRDPGREYGVGSRENKFELMVKAPNFPLHVYFDGFFLAKKGDRQQRFLGGSGFYNDMQRISEGRSVDYLTSIYKIGLNSHLGLVEMDFAHTEKRFDVDNNPVMVENYTPSGFRPVDGKFAHNLTPETEGSGNILKIHSSYTGQWVAAATIMHNERENNYSGAESEVVVGTGSVTWNPLTSLTLGLRYTHRDRDNESPATVTVTEIDPPDWSNTYAVRQPISSKTDTLHLTGRYKPVKGLTFRAKYVFQNIDRTNAGLWNLTDSTIKNTITLAADSRLHSKVLFNIKYAYQNISDPAYNTDPEHSHTGRIGLTWLVNPKFNMLFSYDLNHQERDNLNFLTTNEAWYRESDTNNLLVMGTYQMSKKFTFNASYSYLQYEVVQDLVYNDLGGIPQVDRNVPMDQKAHVLTVGLHYYLSDALYLLGEVTSTRSEGGFSPSSDDLLEPVSIASFSQMEQRYLLLHLGAEYKLSDSLNLDFDYRFADLEDALDNIYDDVDDGEAHILMLSATKKW